MPNVIDATGLTLQTRAELIAQYTAAMELIYGDDTNLASDSPDGQMLNIFAQSILDVLDLLMQVYNMFDPDNAIGAVLDQRVAINGIQRQAGTHTVTNLTIVASQALTLFGLDQDVQPIFTVADNAGNKWQLQTTHNISGPGTYVYSFQAAIPGAVLTVPNTITVPVSIVLGIVSINNPTTYTSLGLNEETDAVLRIRRQKSVALSSQGYFNSLLAALENINGVTAAFVYENVTGTTDGDGVPGHSIWVIVGGTYSNADVANAIYTKRNSGCGMFGAVSYQITQKDGSIFTVFWDVVEAEALYIKFTATSLDGVNLPNISAIRPGLVTTFVPGVNEQVNINDLATLVQNIDNNTLVTGAGFSVSPTGPFTTTLIPSAKNKQFAITAANIIIIPVELFPTSSIVAALGTKQFTAYGGYGGYTYSILVNNSGGSISGSGLYTAGSTPSVIDTVKVIDSQGNFVTSTVQVI